MSQSAPAETSANSYVANLLAQALLMCFMLLILLIGAWVAGAGFHDPDTCWLMALGRLIFETRSLPQTDPFSFTFGSGTPQPFVMYQWLTELLLYCAYALGGLLIVEFFVSVVICASFVLIPFATFDKLGVSRPRTMVLIALGWAGAAFHLLIRPEIFSYLLLSAWLAVLVRVRTKGGAIDGSSNSVSTRIDWKAVVSCLCIMVLWTNLHTGFTSAFVVTSILLLAGTVAWLVQPARGKYPYKTLAVIFASSALASLVNPYGIGLWQYIPRLFFGGFNRTIVELQPLGFAELLQPTWYPFFAVVVLVLRTWMNAVKSPEMSKIDKVSSGILILAMIGLSFKFRRLVSFGSVVLIYECALLSAQVNRYAMLQKTTTGDATTHDATTRDATLWSQTDTRLKQILSVNAVSVCVALAISLAGTLLIASKPVVPRLPQPSLAFAYPTEIMAYIKEHPLQGRGFNAPQLGDVLIWESTSGNVQCPKLFIDTRFDMYGTELVDEYREIAFGKPGWKAVFDSYGFDWAFVHAKNQIAAALRSDPQWKIAAEGSEAVLFVRNVGQPKHLSP